MASFEITLSMLKELWRCGKNPLYDYVHLFVIWARIEEGCWWWIKEGAKRCLKCRIVNYWGSIDRRKKEEYAIQEIPFIPDPEKIGMKDYYIYRKLLIEKWLKFINQRDSIKEKINKEYDNVTDPRF